MEEGSTRKFIETIIFLTKLFTNLKDEFLAQKLYDRISGLLASYTKFLKDAEGGGAGHGVAQYMAVNDLLVSVDDTLEFLDYLEHAKATRVTPLLFSRKIILSFKLDLLKVRNNVSSPSSFDKKERQESAPVAKISKISGISEGRLNQNKERILNFIKKFPNSRTKYIIQEFSALSERTVKRNLKELTRQGFLYRRVKDKAVHYSSLQ